MILEVTKSEFGTIMAMLSLVRTEVASQEMLTTRPEISPISMWSPTLIARSIKIVRPLTELCAGHIDSHFEARYISSTASEGKFDGRAQRVC
jgi:hypothetical protein